MAENIQNMMSVNALEAAARMADIESLYRVIKQDPHVLEHIDSIPFVDTPLHVAASVNLSGHTQFATEIMILKPSFALKLNVEGLTPIHLALQNGCNTIALRLVHFNKDLVRAKMRGGLTPLHLASQYGDIGLLTEFLKACPDSIEDETVTGETALHLAIKNNFEAFEFLVKWLKTKPRQLKRTILNRKDDDGKTILHTAALNNAREAIELLRKVAKFWMDFDAANLMGQTASDLAGSADIQRLLVRPRETMFEKIGSSIAANMWRLYPDFRHAIERMTEEKRSAYLVVATLVATSIYQAALSPPGGLHQSEVIGSNHTLAHSAYNSSIVEGKSVMSNLVFIVYSTTNTIAFLASTFTIIVLLPSGGAWILLYTSIYLLMMSYYTSMTVISPNNFTKSFFGMIFDEFSYIFVCVLVALIW